MSRSVITGTGSYIPTMVRSNDSFLQNRFFTSDRVPVDKPASVIVEKLRNATGIMDRRYAPEGMRASDMGIIAARDAIADSGIDPETIDQIIVAHNFGDINQHSVQ